jgi:hypothetical protein
LIYSTSPIFCDRFFFFFFCRHSTSFNYIHHENRSWFGLNSTKFFQSSWDPNAMQFIIITIIHLFTCEYIVWVISTPCPCPPPSPFIPPSLPCKTCPALISNFVEEKT